jgi:hypothetical protein
LHWRHWLRRLRRRGLHQHGLWPLRLVDRCNLFSFHSMDRPRSTCAVRGTISWPLAISTESICWTRSWDYCYSVWQDWATFFSCRAQFLETVKIHLINS